MYLFEKIDQIDHQKIDLKIDRSTKELASVFETLRIEIGNVEFFKKKIVR